MSVEYIETRLLEETMVGTGSKKILRADEDGLEDGKLLKSSSTGISSADLSDHLEGTPGQIVVSTDGNIGGVKIGFPSTGTVT
ncbi:MAG: hypothetical protein M0R38_10835, partial [Bacteroidia bacterium]|nr:hypothetical protein [Bacteroidia bacterium]